MLLQPISSEWSGYFENVPSRAEVINLAADKYGLDPVLLGGIYLLEARDQSYTESIGETGQAIFLDGDGSLGIGQMKISTAMGKLSFYQNAFSDTVGEFTHPTYKNAGTKLSLTRQDVVELLTSDETAIFAHAKYVRDLANFGANRKPNEIKKLKADAGKYTRFSTMQLSINQHFPGLNIKLPMDTFDQSRLALPAVPSLGNLGWRPAENFIIASEYTSFPFDTDNDMLGIGRPDGPTMGVNPAWAIGILPAMDDVRAANIF